MYTSAAQAATVAIIAGDSKKAKDILKTATKNCMIMTSSNSVPLLLDPSCEIYSYVTSDNKVFESLEKFIFEEGRKVMNEHQEQALWAKEHSDLTEKLEKFYKDNQTTEAIETTNLNGKKERTKDRAIDLDQLSEAKKIEFKDLTETLKELNQKLSRAFFSCLQPFLKSGQVADPDYLSNYFFGLRQIKTLKWTDGDDYSTPDQRTKRQKSGTRD